MESQPRSFISITIDMWRIIPLVIGPMVFLHSAAGARGGDAPHQLFERYCFACHADGAVEGNLDLKQQLQKPEWDATRIFEHLITEKMPPRDAEQPSHRERLQMAGLLAERQTPPLPTAVRRISRFEFNHRMNDLLGTDQQVTASVPDDRGTLRYDTDQRIRLTTQQLAAYFAAADQLLEAALPEQGFLPEYTWNTNRLRDSHHTYNIYTKPFKKGILFSWTRANNGNSYSFFYDDFAPPVAGWYELTFDAAKVGDFEEDVTIQVHAGKYYFADDRPQPQRILDVISVGDREVESYTVRGFFKPGESLSVHCFSQHTWRKENTTEGVYIENVKVRGPLHQWPPESFAKIFPAIDLDIPNRSQHRVDTGKSTLERIGGTLAVSSFEPGMGKERLLDGSNRTHWRSKISDGPAEPPHFVTIKNPERSEIEGLTYSTLSGGDGNGQVKSFAIYVSANGVEWGDPIVKGDLLTRLAAEQKILFPKPVTAPFIKFLITDSYSTGEPNCAAIGKLDVMAAVSVPREKVNISVATESDDALERVIQTFAQRAFAGKADDASLVPYVALARNRYQVTGDFVAATKLALKAMLCSRQFLLPEDDYPNQSYRIAAELARTLWLSVPDAELLDLAKKNQLSGPVVREQIDRMLSDHKSARMVHSFCDQWLHLRFFKQVPPSLKLYPLYDDLLDYYLPRETEMFLRDLILNNLPVGALIDAEFSFLNQRLAQHYGVEGVTGQQMRKVTLPPESVRGGLMTMGSVLKVTTDGLDSSPIRRGAWISRRIAGNTLAPPPENISSIEPDTSGATTIREQIQKHQEKDACAACHKNIDPYGFGLERFDAVGHYRARYRVSEPHGGTFGYQRGGHFSLAGEVDASGEIEGEAFEGVQGLKKILLASPEKIAYNLMKQFFEYANGREPTLAERVALFNRIGDDAEDWGMKDLVKEVLVFSLIENRDEP